jgi:hypothetical protein
VSLQQACPNVAEQLGQLATVHIPAAPPWFPPPFDRPPLPGTKPVFGMPPFP